MSADSATIAATYFEAWETADVDLLRTILADDVSFRGPLAQVQGADEYAESIRGLFGATEKLVKHRVFVDGDDVLTWFDLHLPGAPPTPVAQWCHIEGGQVTRVQVTFDPRGILAASQR
ncbi:MAG: nuclear transport factor 2 family protein [Solirubrobacteraceae bacterium]